ncbi:glycoprotein antigen BM86-like [Amblyomma americanum]
MNGVRLFLYLGVVVGLASATDTAEPPASICATAGLLCGGTTCVALGENKYFTCGCGKGRYFNATAQRCYHINACLATTCTAGACVDNDGIDAAKCNCSGIHGLTDECQVDAAFKEACEQGGGEERLDPNGLPQCDCPDGTENENGTCKSIACLFPEFTCEHICNNAKLREDQRCCQNWMTGSCDADYEPGTYCLPGTIGNASDCTNACATGDAGPLCKHGCSFDNSSSAQYTCKCAEGEELNSDGRTCRVKVSCNEKEAAVCQARDRTCVYKDGEALCQCPLGSVERGGVCSKSCSLGKQRECQPLLSKCVIDSEREACVCERPLKWDPTERKCILDKQFIYITSFKQYQNASGTDIYSKLNCSKTEELIYHAMENLYGAQLIAAKLLTCREEYEVELSFSEEQLPERLNRIHLCENGDKTKGCFFAPALYVTNGSATDPKPVDLCDIYLSNTDAVSKGSHKCISEGAGRYTLQCARGSSRVAVQQGFLKMEQCEESCRPNPCREDCICEPDAITGHKCSCRPAMEETTLQPQYDEASGPVAAARSGSGRVWASVAIVVGILIPAVVVIVLLIKRKRSASFAPDKRSGSKDFQRIPNEEC